MNLDLIETNLPERLSSLVQEIEALCGFAIRLEHDPFLRVPGMLVSGPLSMTIKVKRIPVDLAVLAHELCHARRYYNRKIWMMESIPPRTYQAGGVEYSLAENLDNALEHIFIQQEMEDEFGYPKHDSHVVEDLSSIGIETDPTLLHAILLTTWLLSNRLFPQHVERIDGLLKEHGLFQTAETLLAEFVEARGAKAKVVAALIKALGIPDTEVRLRHRDPEANGQDTGAMLREVLEVEASEDSLPTCI